MNCSQTLHDKIEGAFVRPDFPTADRFMLMESDWTGHCRMLGSDGLCMLQKECGESAITEVCRVYPRSYKSENGLLNACCSGSCEAVVELLLRTEPLCFRLETQSQLSAGKAVHPEITETVGYDLASIFHYVVSVLQDRSHSLSDRIGIISEKAGVSLAHRGLNEVFAHRPYITEDFSVLYNTILPIIKEFSDEAHSFAPFVAEFEDRYKDNRFTELFPGDLAAFESHFPDWSCYFENLICNNMLYSSFPAVDSRVDPHKAVLGLSLEYTLLRVISICHTAVCSWSRESLVDAIAETYHIVEHTAFYYNTVLLLEEK